MKVLQTLILVGVFIIIVGCKGNFIPIEEICKKHEIIIPTSSEFPDDDAVVILDKTEWEMKINENFDLNTSKERHVVKKIFNNLNKHSTIKIPIYQGDEIVNISARTIKQDGTIMLVEKNNIFTIEGVEDESEFYSDMKFKKFTFPGLEEGCTIEYYYKKYVSFPFLRDIWLLQRDIPIIYSEYSLVIPELLMTKGKFTWYYKVYNDKTLDKVTRSEVIQNTSTVLDKQVMFKWMKRDTKAFDHEPMMPKGLSEMPYVRFRPGFWKNWDDLSTWYYNELFKPKLIISEEIKNKSKELTKDINDRTNKIKACYDYVKDIRYISINLNNEGIIPNEPVVVLKNQYGDCKDKSIFLLSLLKSINIEAEPVLLLTNNEGSFDKDFPSWNFNHMIIVVKDEEGKYLWLDPTAEYTEYGDLPAMDQDLDVLVLHENGTSSIVKTQSSDSQKNRKIINLNIEILENLKSNIEFDIKFYGEERSRIQYFIEKSSEKEISEYCKSMITDEFLNSIISSVTYSDSISQEFVNLNFMVRDVDMIQKQEDLFFVSYDFLPFINNMNWLLLDERVYPLVFSYPRTIIKNISIKLPNDVFKLNMIPKKYNEKEKNLILYSQNITSGSNIINISKELNIMNKFVRVKDYKKFRSVFESIQQRNKEQLILEKI